MKTIREEWKIYCRKLYRLTLDFEKKVQEQIEESFRTDKPFSHRQALIKKLRWCDEEKKRITKAVDEKQFYIGEDDPDIIEKLGWEYFFRYRAPGLETCIPAEYIYTSETVSYPQENT